MKARRVLVEPNADVSMRRQCEVGVNRSSLYYEPVKPDAEELALMRRIDELHLEHPFFGSRMMTRTLKSEGWEVNGKRILTYSPSSQKRGKNVHPSRAGRSRWRLPMG